jgi:hypothetical protein
MVAGVVLGFLLSEYIGGIRVRLWQRQLRDDRNPATIASTKAQYELRSRGFPDPAKSAMDRRILDTHYFRWYNKWKRWV